MSEFDERAWFVFAMTVDPVADVVQPTLNYVPANTEADARAKMRRTVCKELIGRVADWPLVATRFASREALERSFRRRVI